VTYIDVALVASLRHWMSRYRSTSRRSWRCKTGPVRRRSTSISTRPRISCELVSVSGAVTGALRWLRMNSLSRRHRRVWSSERRGASLTIRRPSVTRWLITSA